MKKLLIFTLLFSFILNGQENSETAEELVSVGDTLVLGKPSGKYYKYVYFPKTNFIIKKGGIPDYKIIPGRQVIVSKINRNQKKKTKITVKGLRGKKFFNSISEVPLDFEAAIRAKEVLLYQ